MKQLKEIKRREHDLGEMTRSRDKEVHPVAEDLSIKCRIFCIKVLTTFLKAGVPLNRLDVFRPLLEESGIRLTNRTNMAQLIPVIQEEGKKRKKGEITGQELSLTFDGTTRSGEALAINLDSSKNGRLNSGWLD